jgi:hypothetical protein
MRHLGGSDLLECANLADHATSFSGDGLAFGPFFGAARGRGGVWVWVWGGCARGFGVGANFELIETVCGSRDLRYL